MQKVILKLIEICSFRAAPQDLPASIGLLRIIVIASVAVEAMGGVAFADVQTALLEGLFELVVVAVVLYSMLNWQNKQARFIQSFTALTGTGLVISVLSLPLVFAMANANAAGDPIANYAVIALLFLAWQVSVFAHIIRHTFEIHYGYALVATVIFIILYVQLAGALFLGKT